MKNVFSILIICLISTLSLSAQTNSIATIDNNFKITLPAEKQMSNVYTIDISKLTFKDQATCEAFFDMMHEMVVNYSVNYPEKTVTLTLTYDDRNEGYDTEKWNKYFAARSKKMIAVYANLNAQ